MDVLEERTKYHSGQIITFPPAITTACMSPAGLMTSAKDLGLYRNSTGEAEAICVQILPGANLPL